MPTTIDEIAKLQNQENVLLQKLDQGNGNPENNISMINNLTSFRMHLFDSLEKRYNDFKDLGGDTDQRADQNIAMVNIIENNLTQSKKSLENINSTKGGKLRKIEINTYYNQKYQSYIEILYLMIQILIIILVLGLVRKIGFVPSNIMNAVLSIVCILGIFIVLYKTYDISNRNNMYFDEYDSFLNSHSLSDQPSILEYNKQNFLNKVSGQINKNMKKVAAIPAAFSGCVGDACCGKNTSWNSSLSKCVYIEPPEQDDDDDDDE